MALAVDGVNGGDGVRSVGAGAGATSCMLRSASRASCSSGRFRVRPGAAAMGSALPMRRTVQILAFAMLGGSGGIVIIYEHIGIIRIYNCLRWSSNKIKYK